ncbi:hypothetical protein AK812_SmicGene16055, partial [Symbiodinium microadriaticum]
MSGHSAYIVFFVFILQARGFWTFPGVSVAPARAETAYAKPYGFTKRCGGESATTGLGRASNILSGGPPLSVNTANSSEVHFAAAGEHHGQELEVRGQSSYTPAKAPPPAWDGSRGQDLAWSAGAWSAPRRPWSPRRKSEKGKGKGGKPDRESSQGRAPHGPAPPKAAQLPKPPTRTPVPGPSSAGKEAMASAGSSSSVEKAALDKILLAMKENESDLTPQLRDLLAQHQQVDAREEAKVMHRVVASKAAAKKELHKLRAARCSYVQAWSAYLDQILTTVQSQVEEHTATMAEYATKEGQWEQALQEAASALTRMATDGPQAISDEDEEKDIELMESWRPGRTKRQRRRLSARFVDRLWKKPPRNKAAKGLLTCLTDIRGPIQYVSCETWWNALQLQADLAFDELGLPFTPGEDTRLLNAEVSDEMWHWQPPDVEPVDVPRSLCQRGHAPCHAPVLLPADARDQVPRPTVIKVMVAEALELLPETIKGPFKYAPIDTLPALAGAVDGEDEHRHFAVFDPVFHSRSRRRAPDWNVIECVADAVAASRTAQLIVRPLPGLPLPQFTLCPVTVDRPLAVLPVDARGIGLHICTVAVAPGYTILEVVQQMIAAACDRSGLLSQVTRRTHALLDASGQPVDSLAEQLHQHEWLVIAPLSPAAIGTIGAGPSPASTTSTCTMMQARPPGLLGADIGAWPISALPAALAGAELSPASMSNTAGARLPVSHLCLFPEFGLGEKRTIPFSLLTKGFPPVRLQGSSRWSMVEFSNYAAMQLDSQPVRVQFLTTPLPDLDIPQVVVTVPGDVAGGVLVPLDLRALGLGILTLPISAEATVRDILDRAAECEPDLHDRLVEPWGQDRVYLQDHQGLVYESMPRELSALQWLVLRVGAQPFPTRRHIQADPSAFAVPGRDAVTTATTTMMSPGPQVSFVLVCEGATVRTANSPVDAVNLQQVVVELVRGLVGLGRLGKPFRLTLAPILPRTTASNHYVIPLLAHARPTGTTVFYDPGTDGLQLSSLTLSERSTATDVLAPAQRQAGFRLQVNGVPSEL